MTTEIKTAIKSAEERLENEKLEQLKTEVYQFLKQELQSIDDITDKITHLNEQRRVHEENIKNIKAGNLEAVERRREALQQAWHIPWSHPLFNRNPTAWYNSMIAGFTIKIGDKTFIF